MTIKKYLTAEEVAERYCGAVTAGTLRNWRAMQNRAFFRQNRKGRALPGGGA